MPGTEAIWRVAFRDFYNYDADNKGWYVYGQGKVSPDKSQVIPNPGVVIYEFTGAMVSNPINAAKAGAKAANPKRGEPVDLQTGLFVYQKTDLAVSDVIPIVLTRMYRQMDSVPHAFGIGTNHPYDMFMVGDNNGNFISNQFPEGYTYQDLILADGGRIHFQRTSPCTGTNGYCDFINAVYTATSTTTDFYGATIRFDGNLSDCFGGGDCWIMTKKDGTSYTFPDSDNSTVPQAAAPVGMHDRYGNTLTFTRDSSANLTQITSPNGRYIGFTYDTSNRITQAQDNIGRTVTYTYDTPCGTGLLCTVTDANGGLWTYTYDTNHNMLTIKDARQIVYLTNQYDANNRVQKQTLADGTSTYQYGYTLDSNGNVTQTNVTDPRGYVEQVTFNSDGYMGSDTFAVGNTAQQAITYNRQSGSGLLQSVTDALGRTTAYTYDQMGNVTSITRLAGTSNAVTTRFAYEPGFNRVTAITDPLGHTSSFYYDNNGNVVAAVDPLGNSTTTTYNSAGQPVSVTDPLGNTTQFSYDSGDLVGITDPLGRTTSRFLDGAGRPVYIADPLGRVTRSAYNSLDQVTSVTDPLGNQTSFTYDGNGNRLTVTDANNHTTTYTPDNFDRVQSRKDALQNSESYQYDGNSNVIQFTDRRGKVTTFTYDALNRRTLAGFGTQPGPTYESTISYTYDAGNRLTQAVDSTTGTITRGYDGMDHLTSETTPQGTVSYTDDAASRRQTMTVAGQTAVTYTFDNAGRLTQITQGTSTVSFGYDAASRRTSLTLPNGVVENHSYDAASEVSALNYQLNAVSLGNLTYTYDLDGRRTSEGGTFARTGIPNAISVTGYNANNQLTAWGSATPTYDLNGNTLSDGTNTYVWDARNHLNSMNTGAQSSQYDPFGRRTSKTISSTTTNYLYDGMTPVQELSGATPTANLLIGGVDEYFTRTDSVGTRNFLPDALGSTLALADSAGTIQTSYTFGPFGNTSLAGSSSTNTFQYTGRENDGTGIYYYRARYYSPTSGRFITEDPLGFRGGDIDLYSYGGNDPVNHSDASGLYWPGTHYDITYQAAMENGYSPKEAAALAEAVAEVDSRLGTQTDDAYDANTHAMAGRKPGGAFQNCQQAYTATQEQISQDVASNDLAKALHTIQDSYSPAHVGYQQWDGGTDLTWLALYAPYPVSGSDSGDLAHVPSLQHMVGDFIGGYHESAATSASALFLLNHNLQPSDYLSPNPCPGPAN